MFASRTQWNLRSNRFSAAVEAHRKTGRKLFDLTVSNPTKAGLTYDQTAILNSLNSQQSLQYDPHPLGLRPSRVAVAEYYENLQPKGSISPGHILLTTSTSEAYSFCFRLLCDPGDRVLAPQPSYPLFDYLADIQDVSLAPYPLVYDHGWQIDFALLLQGITPRTRAILVVHPNNPTGSYVKRRELQELNRICAPRGIAIIADEVFLDFAGGEGQSTDFVSSFTQNHEVLTFTLSGLSKISALPQMKVAWIVASGPPALLQDALARLEIISDTYLSLSTPLQLATSALLQLRFTMQPQLKERVRANLAELDEQLARQAQCSRLMVEAGWYAVMRVPAIASDEDIVIGLLEKESVLVHPGHFYDFPAPGFLVLSLITPPQDFKEGLHLLFSAIPRLEP